MSVHGTAKVFVLDGGFSTQLSRYVGSTDGNPLWSARFLQTNPEDIIKTHLDFLRAGSDIISTNTYQASVQGFVKHLGVTPEEGYKLIRLAVDLAKRARELYLQESETKHEILIAGSVGPYGAYLHDASEYTGQYADTTPPEVIDEWHTPRIQTLVEAGVDLLALETIPCQKEAEVLANKIKQYPAIKAWMSFSCKSYDKLAHGENLQKVARKCWDINSDQLVALGFNCCSPEIVTKAIKVINDGREQQIPIVTYPNSGEKYVVDEGWVGKDKCISLDNYVYEWLESGVKYVGGCCRTGDSDIAKICDRVKSWCEEKYLK